MTKAELKKAMKLAGVEGKVRGSGANLEVEVAGAAAMRKLCRAIPGLGGMRTGCGSWVLRPSYMPMGDFNNPASAWHY